MCHVSCIIFGAKILNKEEVQGRSVIEIGSLDVNGSLRPIIESWRPSKYIGVDIKKGPGVDIICNVENIIEQFGKESFDIVISTELLEHIKNWKKAVSNIKNICKKNGMGLITTRSYGFPYHGYPNDFWRYEVEDMKNIFSDCEILALEDDPYLAGVFIKWKKPSEFFENNLSQYPLYSVVVNRKIKELTDKNLQGFYYKRLVFKDKLKNIALKIGKAIFS